MASQTFTSHPPTLNATVSAGIREFTYLRERSSSLSFEYFHPRALRSKQISIIFFERWIVFQYTYFQFLETPWITEGFFFAIYFREETRAKLIEVCKIYKNFSEVAKIFLNNSRLRANNTPSRKFLLPTLNWDKYCICCRIRRLYFSNFFILLSYNKIIGTTKSEHTSVLSQTTIPFDKVEE